MCACAASSHRWSFPRVTLPSVYACNSRDCRRCVFFSQLELDDVAARFYAHPVTLRDKEIEEEEANKRRETATAQRRQKNHGIGRTQDPPREPTERSRSV